MSTTINIEISKEDIINAVKSMSEDEKKSFIIELLAAVAPEYLGSPEQAGEDYVAGQISTHSKSFGN